MSTIEWVFITIVAMLKIFSLLLQLILIDKPRKPITDGQVFANAVASIIGFAILVAVLAVG